MMLWQATYAMQTSTGRVDIVASHARSLVIPNIPEKGEIMAKSA